MVRAMRAARSDLATRFLVVSKSGGTAETMMQAGGAILALEAQGLDIGTHMGGIAGAAIMRSAFGGALRPYAARS